MPFKLKPLTKTAIKNTPAIERQIAPEPPAIDVPPTTIAAMTAKITLKSSEACAEVVRIEFNAPARPAPKPPKVKAII